MGKWAELHARGPHQPHPTPRHVDDVGGNAVMAWVSRLCPDPDPDRGGRVNTPPAVARFHSSCAYTPSTAEPAGAAPRLPRTARDPRDRDSAPSVRPSHRTRRTVR